MIKIERKKEGREEGEGGVLIIFSKNFKDRSIMPLLANESE